MNAAVKYALAAALVVGIMLVGIYFWPDRNSTPENNSPSGETTPTPPAETENPVPKGAIILYTDESFVPQTVTVKKGDKVTWLNGSSDDMWIGADPHPVHTSYPEKGGCVDSVFDQCEKGAPGSQWTFEFNSVGMWNYHNHANATHRGTVVVNE